MRYLRKAITWQPIKIGLMLLRPTNLNRIHEIMIYAVHEKEREREVYNDLTRGQA